MTRTKLANRHIPQLYVEMSLEDGLAFVSQGKDVPHYFNGERLSTASGSALFVQERHNLCCCNCNLKASKWQAYTEKNNYPVLNLYGVNEEGKNILFTRDHIIPKSIGGNEDLRNLRVMCSECNNSRKAFMTSEEMQFAVENFDTLFIHTRTLNTIKRTLFGIENNKIQMEDAISNYKNISYLFDELNSKNLLPETHKEYEPILTKIKMYVLLSSST